MGILDGTSVTVDAVLTKKGRQIIKNGGTLNITSFTAGDTGVDYTLWNPTHPSGSSHYGEGIENLPMLEASVHAKYSLRNRLITLPQNTIVIPTLELQLPGTSTVAMTFENNDVGTPRPVVANLKGLPVSNAGPRSLFVIINNPSVVMIGGNAKMVTELDGIARDYIREAGIDRATVYQIMSGTNGGNLTWQIHVAPDTTQTVAGRQTQVTVIETETGAYGVFDVTNNVTELSRNLLGNLSTKGS